MLTPAPADPAARGGRDPFEGLTNTGLVLPHCSCSWTSSSRLPGCAQARASRQRTSASRGQLSMACRASSICSASSRQASPPRWPSPRWWQTCWPGQHQTPGCWPPSCESSHHGNGLYTVESDRRTCGVRGCAMLCLTPGSKVLQQLERARAADLFIL